MSNSFIHFTSADWKEVGYENECEILINKIFPDVTYFNLDAKSDPGIADLGVKLINQSEKLVVFLELDEKIQPRIVVRLLNKVERQKGLSYQIFSCGVNSQLKKMLQVLDSKEIPNISAINEELAHFFKS